MNNPFGSSNFRQWKDAMAKRNLKFQATVQCEVTGEVWSVGDEVMNRVYLNNKEKQRHLSDTDLQRSGLPKLELKT